MNEMIDSVQTDTPKPASRLHFMVIAFLSGLVTFWHCSRVIVGSYFKKNYRRFVTEQMYQWSRRLLALIRLSVDTKGREHLHSDTQRPIIVMCNHSSMYDIPISAIAAGVDVNLRMMAKKELYRIPLFGQAMRRGEFLKIDRQDREQAMRDLEYAKQKMKEGIILWVAPEGTRSKDGSLLPFKKGAFHVAIDMKALIVPLVIKDVWKVQPGKELKLTVGQKVHAEFLPPIDASEFSVEQRAVLIEKVRSSMQAALEDR